MTSTSSYSYSITCDKCGVRVYGTDDKSLARAREQASRKMTVHNRKHKKQR